MDQQQLIKDANYLLFYQATEVVTGGRRLQHGMLNWTLYGGLNVLCPLDTYYTLMLDPILVMCIDILHIVEHTLYRTKTCTAGNWQCLAMMPCVECRRLSECWIVVVKGYGVLHYHCSVWKLKNTFFIYTLALWGYVLTTTIHAV